MRYIAELERKVQTLQTEATSLSTQLTLLQVDWHIIFVLIVSRPCMHIFGDLFYAFDTYFYQKHHLESHGLFYLHFTCRMISFFYCLLTTREMQMVSLLRTVN